MDLRNGFDAVARTSGLVPDPAKSQVPINLTQAGAVSLAGTRVFKKGAGGDFDITGWSVIKIRPSASDLTRYFNDDNTKTCTILNGEDCIIPIHPDVTKITITGNDTRVEVEGM